MDYLGDIPIENAKTFPDHEAVVFEETRLNWTQFNERINRFANGLYKLGFKPGDHIAVLLENCHQYMEIYYALAKNGMVTVPLNYRLSEKELIYIINHSESVCLIAGERFIEKTKNMQPNLDRIEKYISVEFDAGKKWGHVLDTCPHFLPYEEIIESGDPAEPKDESRQRRDSDKDMTVLMYTGGTTGLPKGVMLSHKNLLSAIKAIGEGVSMPGARTLFILPLFHIANWQAFLFHMMNGCVVINRGADPEEIVNLIMEEKPIMLNLVPTVYQYMLQLPNIEKMDFSHVLHFSVAGAPMAHELMKRCEEVFGMKFGKGYGLTEAAPTVSSLGGDDYALEGDPKLVKRSKSVGKPFKNIKVVIRREDGTECDVEEHGEITAFGDNVMLGYWRDPEKTAQTLRDGWLWTGDIGYMDEDGFIYLADRKDDMIISGGENVYPNEVENALYEHPAVLEVAVVGVPDEKWGEAVKAVVALKPGQKATEEELIAFCKTRIAGYKSPKSIDFVDELPKTTVGKILRREVREKYWEGHDKGVI